MTAWGPAKEIRQSDTNYLFEARQTFYIQRKEYSRRVDIQIGKVNSGCVSEGSGSTYEGKG